MANDRNNQTVEEQKTDPRQNSEANKENTSGKDKPQDRLKDGTNDFANGDQEPMSEKSESNKQ